MEIGGRREAEQEKLEWGTQAEPGLVAASRNSQAGPTQQMQRPDLFPKGDRTRKRPAETINSQ